MCDAHGRGRWWRWWEGGKAGLYCQGGRCQRPLAPPPGALLCPWLYITCHITVCTQTYTYAIRPMREIGDASGGLDGDTSQIVRK